jgi:glycosyltransferase involved in cell wall biosynthesis
LRHNDEIKSLGRWQVAKDTLWSRKSYHEVRSLIRRERPDVMHCTNTFPLLSPAVYYAAKEEKVPVVQGLHNYRQICPAAVMVRDGQVCEDCLGKSFAWPAVVHRCYRNSRAGSLVVAGMLALHRWMATWTKTVSRYYAVSAFARNKFVEAGVPEEMIDVKWNFIDTDPGVGPGHGGYAVYVGRLSHEKGVRVLIDAWSRLRQPMPLKIVGDGPCRDELQRAAAENPLIEMLGARPLSEVYDIIGNAAVLVIPSIWYEAFGRTIIEAFAKGTPVIGSRIGAISELLMDGEAGYLFHPGDPADLADKVRRFQELPSPAPLRAAARRSYENRFTADANYQVLMQILQRAVDGPSPPLRRAAGVSGVAACEPEMVPQAVVH